MTTEHDLLRGILSHTPSVASALVGPGDDAAVLTAAGAVVATTDTLVHGPDFRLAWTSPFDLGWKAAAVNLSDVAAMGAVPTALLVALCLPAGLASTFTIDMADGLAAACAALAPAAGVVGGDLTSSDTLTVAVTALGSLGRRTAVLRSGARPGDVVALAGRLAAAARGLRVLFDRFRDDRGDPISLDLLSLSAGERSDVAAQLRPTPPIALGPVAADAGATAMMDVSDGLVLDARRLAEASGVGIDLDPEGVLDVARRELGARDCPDERLLADALAGGEDHGLLATFPPGRVPEGFVAIGRVVDAASGIAGRLSVAGIAYSLRGGWDPYIDWDSRRG